MWVLNKIIGIQKIIKYKRLYSLQISRYNFGLKTLQECTALKINFPFFSESRRNVKPLLIQLIVVSVRIG